MLESFVMASYFNAIINFILGLFVYFRGKKNQLNIVWGLFCLTVAVWSCGLGLMVNSNSEELAIIWLKYVHYVGLIFLPITFFHFCLILANIHTKMKIVIIISYITGFFFLIINLFGYLATVKPLYPFKYYTSPYPLYIPFSILFFIFFIFAFYEVFRKFIKATSYNKIQLKYFFIGTVIGFIGGSTAFFPVFNLPLFPYGIYSFSVYTLIVSYAIIRYHLMGINIIIKKSAIHTFMVAFTTIAYITTIFIFENILNYFFQYNTIISRIFAGTIIALTFLPVHNKVKSVIDRILFKKRGEYLQSIKDFSQNLVTILDLRKLLDSIADNICLILSAKHASLFLYDEKDKTYKVNSLSGYKEYERIMRETLISTQSSIVCWLQNNKNLEIKSKLIKEDTDNIYTPVITQMEELNAEIIMPLFFDKKLIGFIILGEKKNQDMYNLEETNLLKSLANQVSIAYTNAFSYNKLKRLYLGTIESFIKAIEAKDKYYQGHSYRIVSVALKIGMEYGLSHDNIELLKYASVLHDIGNIAIPDNILTKPDKLTKKEFDLIKKHPVYGNEIISSIEYFMEAGKIILHHHEQWDGKGYPNNLKGDQIPLLSRIIFIAEVFDGLTSERSYRPPLSKEAAFKEIQKESGKKFDPELVECFVSAYNKNLID